MKLWSPAFAYFFRVQKPNWPRKNSRVTKGKEEALDGKLFSNPSTMQDKLLLCNSPPEKHGFEAA